MMGGLTTCASEERSGAHDTTIDIFPRGKVYYRARFHMPGFPEDVKMEVCIAAEDEADLLDAMAVRGSLTNPPREVKYEKISEAEARRFARSPEGPFCTSTGAMRRGRPPGSMAGKCLGYNQNGSRCKHDSQEGTMTCYNHDWQEDILAAGKDPRIERPKEFNIRKRYQPALFGKARRRQLQESYGTCRGTVVTTGLACTSPARANGYCGHHQGQAQ